MDITITLDADVARETLIALRDRRYELSQQASKHEAEIVRVIAQRQLQRVLDAGCAIANALNESF